MSGASQTSSSITPNPPTSPSSALGHVPKKRKRVTRACDECRKKKVKCDGQMPCIHCTVYSYECTYDQPSSRRKVPDTMKTENRLKYAEMVLDALIPGVDIYSPSFDKQSLVEYMQNKYAKNPQSLQDLRLQPAPTSRLKTESPAEFGSPQSADGTEFKIILPPKHIAIQLIESVWENACVLFRFYHRPSFIRDLDLLYETDPEDYTQKQFKILPLMYSVMAAGVLFSLDKCKELGIKDAGEGYRYFAAARKLIDITDARDLYSIQSIVMMILFLQCSARLSTCYSYIGLALRAALRAGLHRRVQYNFNPIELETRKRLFWTIVKMDVYVNAVLGLPRGISDEDFDQDLPEEIDDENITEDAYFPQQTGKLSSVGISNAHTRLMTVLSHVMHDIYPVHQQASFEKVAALEKEISEWHGSLPQILKPETQEISMEYFKANRLLSMSYCYVRIMLYRPFIHDVRQSYSQQCVGVAREAIYIARDLVSKNMLNGAYWFSVYTLFFSVACLVYCVHEYAVTLPEYSNQLRQDAEIGRDILFKLRESSMAASRTYKLLNSLFEQLNKRIGKPNDGVSVAEISLKSEQGQFEGNNTLISEKSEPVVVPPLEQQPSFVQQEQPPQLDTFAYAPGPMDQVDQQLFGRFLPPYMTTDFDNSDQQQQQQQVPGVPAQDATANATATAAAPVNITTAADTNLFGNSKEWDDFLAQHVELSGVNSFINMDSYSG